MKASNQWLINLSKDESLWATELDEVPSMIHFEYAQLKSLAQEGQVYGVLLQCKDTFETILKIPVIMALVIIDSDSKYKDGSEYAEIMNAFLKSPLSMGSWKILASIIVGKNKILQLPETLIEILKRTQDLYEEDITDDFSDVVNWRNEEIGHGALKFQDDSSYQEEVSTLLRLLKDYFNGTRKFSIKGLYDECYFKCGENKLVAGHYERNIDSVNMSLHVATQSFPVANYINDCDLKWYLFESFYSRKNVVKYSSYIDGKNNTIQNKYFSDLFTKHVLQGSNDASICSDYRTREEEELLEKLLYMPPDYVNQTEIAELLLKKMQDIEKGIITLFMERGTGKSAFANKMSGQYNKKPLIKNSISRCYHISNAVLRGLSDFVSSIEYEFTHSKNSAKDIRGGAKKLPSISLESENPPEDMAKVLNTYHDIYRKKYTVLVIDGIDEITEQTERILDYIPSKEQLDDGVFIVLTTRFADENTVKGKSKKYIEKAVKLTDSLLQVRRYDQVNVELLNRYIIEKYIKTSKLEQNIDKKALIVKSDYRILYLRAYLGISERVDFDSTNETIFIKSYMDYILSFYGINQKQTLREIAVTIALFPGISIKQYQEYLDCQEITYKFVGLFYDLMPLLTVLHVDGEAVYEFADAAYEDFVIEEYPDVVKETIRFFYESLNRHLEGYLNNEDYMSRDMVESINNGRDQLNKNLVFYSEGLLGMWHKSYKHMVISDLFYENLDLIRLTEKIVVDKWADFGYGLYLKNELLNCIVDSLYLGLTNKRGEICLQWTNNLNKIFSNDNFVNIDTVVDWPLRFLKEKVITHNNFGKIKCYLLSNYTSIKSFKEWFWLFVPDFDDTKFPREIINVLENSGYMDDYVDYFLNYANCCYLDAMRCTKFYSACSWAYEFLKTKLSSKSEEKILNFLLEQTIKKTIQFNGKTHTEIARECLNRIKQRNYHLTVYNGNEEMISKKIQESGSDIESILNDIQLVIQTLLKFQTLSENEFSIIERAFRFDVLYVNDENIKLEQNPTRLLYETLYKRLCYERDQGDLVCFLNKIGIDLDFISKMQRALGKADYLNEILKWINIIESIVEKERINTLFIFSKIIVLTVDSLVNCEYENVALTILEDYINKFDTLTFLSSHMFDKERFFSNEIFEKAELIYCTDNALYLLDKLYKKNEICKVTKLLSVMEKSVPFIDSCLDLDNDYESIAKTDIQKYRFRALRDEINARSEFDAYIEASWMKHKNKLIDCLKNISRSSDFRCISFHVEMLLERFWQTRRWDEGEKYCLELVGIIGSTNYFGDTIIEKSIQNEIDRIKECKRFFMFLNGKQVLASKNYIPIRSSFILAVENIMPLYNVINWFQDPKYKNLIIEMGFHSKRRIGLGSYSYFY